MTEHNLLEPKVYKSIHEALLDYAKKGMENYDESMSAPVVVYDPDTDTHNPEIK
jgi:hypothetical protein